MAEDKFNNGGQRDYSSEQVTRSEVAKNQSGDGIDYRDDQVKRSIIAKTQKSDGVQPPASAADFDASTLNADSNAGADDDFQSIVDKYAKLSGSFDLDADARSEALLSQQYEEAKKNLPNSEEINSIKAEMADNEDEGAKIERDEAKLTDADIAAITKGEIDYDGDKRSQISRSQVDGDSIHLDESEKTVHLTDSEKNSGVHLVDPFPGNPSAVKMPEANPQIRDEKLNALFTHLAKTEDYQKIEDLGLEARDEDEMDTLDRFPDQAPSIYNSIYKDKMKQNSVSITGIQTDKDGNLYALTSPEHDANDGEFNNSLRSGFKIDKKSWSQLAEASGLDNAGLSVSDLADHPNTRVEFSNLPYAEANNFYSLDVKSNYEVGNDGTVNLNLDHVDNDLLLPAVSTGGYNHDLDFESKSLNDLKMPQEARDKAVYEKPLSYESLYLDNNVQEHVKHNEGLKNNIHASENFDNSTKDQFPKGEETMNALQADNASLETNKTVSITGVQRGQDGQLYALTQPEDKDGEDARGAFAISDKAWDSLMKASSLDTPEIALTSDRLKEPSTRIELGESGAGRLGGFDKINFDFKPLVSDTGAVQFNVEPDSSNVSFGKTQLDGSETTKSVDEVSIDPVDAYNSNEFKPAYQGNTLVLDKQIAQSVSESAGNQVFDTMNNFEFNADKQLPSELKSAENGYNTKPFKASDYDLRTVQNRDYNFIGNADGKLAAAISQIDKNDNENPRFTFHVKDAMSSTDYNETTVSADDAQLDKLLDLNGRTNDKDVLTSQDKNVLDNDQRLYAKVDVENGKVNLDDMQDVLAPDNPDSKDDYTNLDTAEQRVDVDANPKLVRRIQSVKQQRQFMKDLNAGKIEGVSNSNDTKQPKPDKSDKKNTTKKPDKSKEDDGPDL